MAKLFERRCYKPERLALRGHLTDVVGPSERQKG